MADDIVLNAATRAALQNLQSLQGAALLGLKQAAQNDRGRGRPDRAGDRRSGRHHADPRQSRQHQGLTPDP